MKKIIFAALLTLNFIFYADAQEPIGYVGLGQTIISQQDSTFGVLSITYPINFLLLQDSFILSTSPFFFPLFIREDSTTFVPSLTRMEGINVYPNPTHGSLTFEKVDMQLPLTIELFDTKGVLMKTFDWQEYERSIQTDLSSFPSGTYIVYIHDRESTMGNTYRVIKR